MKPRVEVNGHLAVYNGIQNNVLTVNDEHGKAIYKPNECKKDHIRLKKLMSSYLDGGFHQDILSIEEVTFYEKSGAILFRVKDFFMPSDGQFHVSSILTELCISHAGVMYSHVDNGLSEKKHEVYLRSSSIVFKKPIRDQQILLTFNILKKVVKGPVVFYQANMDFNHGSFIGKVNWIMPLVTEG